MIFKPELAKLVRRGLKTQTRRPIKTKAGTDQPCRYIPGRHYAIQDGYGLAEDGRIEIIEIREELAGDITDHDARLEGFPDAKAFKAYWMRLHDAALVDQVNAEMERLGGDPLDDDDLQAHFENRHAHKRVWVITFKLAGDVPRLLSVDSSKGYTDKAYLALPEEPEAVDVKVQEKYAKEGWAGFRDRERHRILDRRLLALEDRMRLAWGDGQRLGIDLSSNLQAIDRIVSSMERKTDRSREAA